ncbi:hypothetical protein ApNV_022 [Aratus pisonii nudivirus]|nr:hypothetical protein ApNV_022 [Aratus pisonii nudivirus]
MSNTQIVKMCETKIFSHIKEKVNYLTDEQITEITQIIKDLNVSSFDKIIYYCVTMIINEQCKEYHINGKNYKVKDIKDEDIYIDDDDEDEYERDTTLNSDNILKHFKFNVESCKRLVKNVKDTIVYIPEQYSEEEITFKCKGIKLENSNLIPMIRQEITLKDKKVKDVFNYLSNNIFNEVDCLRTPDRTRIRVNANSNYIDVKSILMKNLYYVDDDIFSAKKAIEIDITKTILFLQVYDVFVSSDRYITKVCYEDKEVYDDVRLCTSSKSNDFFEYEYEKLSDDCVDKMNAELKDCIDKKIISIVKQESLKRNVDGDFV